MDNPSSRIVSTFVLLVFVSLVGFASFYRFIAPDEGFYLIAAKMISAGSVPYHDFFFPQMPLLAYLFSGWFELFGTTWDVARAGVGLIWCAIGILLFLRVRATTSLPLAVFALVLFVCNNMILGWMSTAKTYGASTLFTLLAYLTITNREKPCSDFSRAIATGLLLGFAIGIRLYYILLVPIFTWHIMVHSIHSKFRDALFFLSGLLVAAIPHLYLFCLGPNNFWFNNLGFHLTKTDMTPQAVWTQKIEALAGAFGIAGHPMSEGWQLGILLVIAVSYVLLCRMQRKRPDLALAIALTLTFASALPTPIHIQYFCVVVPFLIIVAIQFAHELSNRAQGANPGATKGTPSVQVAIAACLFVGYVAATPLALARYFTTGNGALILTPNNPEHSRITSVQQVSQILDAGISEERYVLARWPGYLLETRALPYPGVENQFWIKTLSSITPTERRKYNIANRRQFLDALRDSDVKLAIVEDTRQKFYLPDRELATNQFTLVTRINGTLIYGRTKG